MAVVAASEKDEAVSANLLRTINRTRKCPDELKLGMMEWTDSDSDKENFQPEKKRKKLSATKRKEHFSEPVSHLSDWVNVFYYNGKKFCLRGGEEHRQLKFL